MVPARTGRASIPGDLRASLVLVRHGESTFVAEGRFQGRLDPPLSALGERQAQAVAAWLSRPDGPPGLGLPHPAAEIVHSPLARAAQSAERIAREIRASRPGDAPVVRAEPALVEISQGRWEGLTQAEVAERWGPRLAAWRARPTRTWAPGGERLSDTEDRVRAALPALYAGLRGAPQGQRPWSIIVAHDGVLRVLLLLLLDLPLGRFWAFPFGLGGVSVVDLGDGQAALRAHNLASAAVARVGDGHGPSRPLDRGGAL